MTTRYANLAGLDNVATSVADDDLLILQPGGSKLLYAITWANLKPSSWPGGVKLHWPAASSTAANTPMLAFADDPDTGISRYCYDPAGLPIGDYTYADDTFAFVTGGIQRAYFGAGGHFCPIGTGVYNSGNGTDCWNDVYSQHYTTVSDARQKADIATSDLGLDFLLALSPVSYRMKTGQRRHYGLVSQDVEMALAGRDFAGFVRDAETGLCGLRYQEFIAPMIAAVQELVARLNALEARIAALEAASRDRKT